MEEDNWDLQAVVRSCSKATTTFSGDPLCSSSSSPLFHPQPNLLSSHPPLGDLQEICRPFFPGPSPLRVDLRPSSHLGHPLQQHQQLKQRPPSNTPSRLKRRKNQVKKVVCHVPADGVCSDVWAWRKYGQKPIKGSPFPRGYYRCSSSKGCPARKLVERSRTDPTTFVVTYTSEHNHGVPSHRSCLAGSTRSSGKTSGGPPPPEAEAPPKKDSSTSSNASDAVITVDEEVLMVGTFHGEEDDDDDDGVCCSNSGGVIEFGSLGC